MSPVRAFATVFSAVFLFIFLGSALLTYLLPETFRARARLFAPEASHLELMQSAKVLEQVAQELKLAETLAARYGEEQALDAARVENLLRRAVQVRRVRGTDLIEVQASGPSAGESTQLANTVAKTGAKLAQDSMKVVEPAVPPLRPSSPNMALNLILGAAVGIFLGIMAGGVGAKLAVGFDG